MGGRSPPCACALSPSGHGLTPGGARSVVTSPLRAAGRAGMQRAARGALRAAAWAPPARLLHAAPPVLAADRAALLALRRSTGLPFLQCREALERCGGDLPQAEAWLQEEAQRRGWIRATELQSRRAPQGLVGIVRQGPLAAMVEVNCETDFVARNGEFQQVVEQAVLSTVALCRTAPPGAGNKHLLAVEELAQLRTEPGGALLSDRIAVATGKLGEKVALRRAAWLRVPEPGGHIAAYAHGWLPASGPLAMGTYGALVACQVPEPWVGGGDGGGGGAQGGPARGGDGTQHPGDPPG
ncbi:LOW QUALITY PROTEIN: elongation factor Ts, mitochondrial [Falco peregrinus]|uniref:LOW QUALITY PROTEIN: elongation factor Ts, mitochondrial n=1 Tax=Falco peregrinus TaxID=8954 RepID=UPI00247A7A73|nr:LOW QUALITY PROTEIN: elongation factor Ts, mitochondrial [Falco peregrinus]